MKRLFFFSTLLLTTSLLAGDASQGKILYKKKGCAICHKKDGTGKAKMKAGKLKLTPVAGPRIAGLSEKYALEQLLAIQGKNKKKTRKTKFTSAMKAKLKKLSEVDLQNLATFVSKELNKPLGQHKGLLE